MKKTIIHPAAGTVCTLTHNDSFIFRLERTDANGYPYASEVIHRGKPLSRKGTACVAYTRLFREAAPGQKDTFRKIFKDNRK